MKQKVETNKQGTFLGIHQEKERKFWVLMKQKIGESTRKHWGSPIKHLVSDSL